MGLDEARIVELVAERVKDEVDKALDTEMREYTASDDFRAMVDDLRRKQREAMLERARDEILADVQAEASSPAVGHTAAFAAGGEPEVDAAEAASILRANEEKIREAQRKKGDRRLRPVS